MEAKLFKDDKEICTVQVIKFNPPGSGCSTIAMPGKIKFSSPMPIEVDGLFTIEIDQKVMQLEFTELATSFVPDQGAICVCQGYIY